MKEKFDFEKFKNDLDSATRKCFLENFEKLGDKISAFSLISDDGAMTVASYDTQDLALVGMHVVGSVKDHPEMVWATFAHADAASGVRNILKMRTTGLEVGPILMGMSNRVHIVSPSITARGLLNMAAIGGTDVSAYG